KSSNNWKLVALKERLYYISTEEHLAIRHKGARAIYAEVSNKYHGVKRCLYKENISDNVQIDNDIQFDVNKDSIQTEYYDNEFNENLIYNLSQSENNDRNNMSFIMDSLSPLPNIMARFFVTAAAT
ncbi:22552_t:CDS:2, partial [Cetraspora pellucida]